MSEKNTMKKICSISIASSIEPPPLMVDRVFDLIYGYLEENSEEPLKTSIDIETDGWKYEIFNGMNIKDAVAMAVSKRIQDNIEKSKKETQNKILTKDIEEIKDEMIKIKTEKLKKINVKAEINDRKYWTDVAEWDAKTMTLSVFLPEDQDILEPEEIKESIYHELRHFSQTYLSLAVYGTSSSYVGMPPDKTLDFKQDAEDPKYRVHDMDDYEFYPRLSESIDRSKEIIRNYYLASDKMTPVNEMIEMIINEDQFFNELEKYPESQKKLQKAKSEFYKAMIEVFEETIKYR